MFYDTVSGAHETYKSTFYVNFVVLCNTKSLYGMYDNYAS